MRHLTNFVLSLAGICLVWAAAPVPAAAQNPPPHGLLCNHEVNPRGVTSLHPLLSWESPSARVRAYQILVASSEEKLNAGEADLWDSGKVWIDPDTRLPTSLPKSVPYQGKPLSSFQHCYWKVQVWSVYDDSFLFSKPASWQMGLLSFDDRDAR